MRKWCSVTHVYLKPTRSAACTIATSSMMRRCSSPRNCGSTHALLNNPNSTFSPRSGSSAAVQPRGGIGRKLFGGGLLEQSKLVVGEHTPPAVVRTLVEEGIGSADEGQERRRSRRSAPSSPRTCTTPRGAATALRRSRCRGSRRRGASCPRGRPSCRRSARTARWVRRGGARTTRCGRRAAFARRHQAKNSWMSSTGGKPASAEVDAVASAVDDEICDQVGIQVRHVVVERHERVAAVASDHDVRRFGEPGDAVGRCVGLDAAAMRSARRAGASTTSIGSNRASIHGAMCVTGPGASPSGKSSATTIVCIHVVPHFGGVQTKMSPGRRDEVRPPEVVENDCPVLLHDGPRRFDRHDIPLVHDPAT